MVLTPPSLNIVQPLVFSFGSQPHSNHFLLGLTVSYLHMLSHALNQGLLGNGSVEFLAP